MGMKFHLPWNQADHYWLYVLPLDGKPMPALEAGLIAAGMQPSKTIGGYKIQSGRHWNASWRPIHEAIQACKADESVVVAVIPGNTSPSEDEIAINRK